MKLEVGKRYLLRINYWTSLVDKVVEELSPSNEYVKFKGERVWLKIDLMVIEEELPNE